MRGRTTSLPLAMSSLRISLESCWADMLLFVAQKGGIERHDIETRGYTARLYRYTKEQEISSQVQVEVRVEGRINFCFTAEQCGQVSQTTS